MSLSRRWLALIVALMGILISPQILFAVEKDLERLDAVIVEANKSGLEAKVQQKEAEKLLAEAKAAEELAAKLRIQAAKIKAQANLTATAAKRQIEKAKADKAQLIRQAELGKAAKLAEAKSKEEVKSEAGLKKAQQNVRAKVAEKAALVKSIQAHLEVLQKKADAVADSAWPLMWEAKMNKDKAPLASETLGHFQAAVTELNKTENSLLLTKVQETLLSEEEAKIAQAIHAQKRLAEEELSKTINLFDHAAKQWKKFAQPANFNVEIKNCAWRFSWEAQYHQPGKYAWTQVGNRIVYLRWSESGTNKNGSTYSAGWWEDFSYILAVQTTTYCSNSTPSYTGQYGSTSRCVSNFHQPHFGNRILKGRCW